MNIKDIEDINQRNLIHQFNTEYRTKFNPELFVESDVGIIEEVKKVILSCQRDSYFTIKVENFEVIEDYEEIIENLRAYEASVNKNNNKDNIYDYINLKDSDIRLLVVYYYISIKEESEHLRVLIALPRAVDKYYFRINGNIYSAMWQIVDASTYNSATSSNKKHSVTLKSMFQPLRIYRYHTNNKNGFKDVYSKQFIKCTFYTSFVFKKSLPAMKYILAKFGYYDAQKFLNLDFINIYDSCPEYDEGLYCINRYNIWITVPKVLYDGDQVMQSFVWTVYMSIQKQTEYCELFSNEFWLLALAAEFNNTNIEKAYSILDSLEFVLDLSIKEKLRLPDYIKSDIYGVLKWMMGEFSNLKIKDNLDVSIKRIRRAEYIASLYAMKLSTSIYRVSDIGKKANLDSIRKAIVTNPMYLINAITSCQLVNYRNYVNDLDSLVALKYTYKGIAGIGEKKNSVPNIYRAVNRSQLTICDLDSSSAGDPGINGTLVPFVQIYDDGLFSDYQEPNYWEASLRTTIANYKSMIGLKEGLIAKKVLLDDESIEPEIKKIDNYGESVKTLIKPLIKLSSNDKFNEILEGVPLEESGLIVYESVDDQMLEMEEELYGS